MKLGPVTKERETRETKQCQKHLTMTPCRKIVTSLSFFGFLVNLWQSRGRIVDKKFAKAMFSVIVTFSLMKTENITKISNRALTLLL